MGLDILILAAGAARRFGGNKLLARWRGHPLLEHVLAAAESVRANSINLVFGAYADEVQAYLQSRPAASHIKHFVNADWQSGMGSSLAFGIAQLPQENAVLVLLADQPLIAPADLQNILALGQKNPHKIICAEFSATRGPPALFPAQYKNELRLLAGDRGAKALLHSADVLTISVAAAAVDIDSPPDLSQLTI